MQAGVAAVEEGRVGGHGQQQREHSPKPVADEHGPIRSPDPDVHVQRERVVPPRHVLEPLLDPAVMLGVDDVLLAVVGPGVGGRGAERDPELGRDREQPAPAIALQDGRAGQVLAPPGPDLDLGGDQLAGDRIGEHRIGDGGVSQLLEPLDERERAGVEQRELLLEPDREVGRCLEGRASGVQCLGPRRVRAQVR